MSDFHNEPWENAPPLGKKPLDLINVARLERRIQELENRLLVQIKHSEQQDIRLDAQLSRIMELEERVRVPEPFVFDVEKFETPAGTDD